ncbi:hypothetical protein ACAG26_27005 [Mycobacterium sp. pUA109]|uniref:hypothetical protein n=1 Tax=Mycobacterium sp. pUA109 TaxID=3238982 RepID=UPI00351BDBE7
MSSPLRPIGDLTRFASMFWFPPGGTDNGVWASAWAELADLEVEDVGPVLTMLAEAGVGGYVATPGGQRRRRGRDEPVIHRLWVDALQYHRAEDVLMTYWHRRDRRH